MAKTLFLDFYSNRNSAHNGNLDPLFQTGLEKQLCTLIGEEIDYDEIIASNFSMETNVGFTWPNFNREVKNNKERNYYNNVAIIIERDSTMDFVLIGDFVEFVRDNNYKNEINFKVKGITSIDKKVEHHGEINEKCEILIKTEFEGNWYSPSGGEMKYPTEEDKTNNVFNDDFINKLKKKFVVKNPTEFKKTINNWKKYLDAQYHILNVDTGEDVIVDSKPKLITAFSSKKSEKINKIGDIDYRNKDQYWSTTETPDSRKGLLLRVEIERETPGKKESEKATEEKRKIDRFTAGQIVLTFSKNDKRENEIVLSDCRVAPSLVVYTDPDDLIDVKNEYDKKIENEKNILKKSIKNEIDENLKEYEETAVKNQITDYRKIVEKQVKEDIEKEIDKITFVETDKIKKEIKDLESEIKNTGEKEKNKKKNAEIKSKIDKAKINYNNTFAKCKTELISKKIGESVEKEIKRLIDAKRKEITPIITKKLTIENNKTVEKINAEKEHTLEDLRQNKSKATFVTYFEINTELNTEGDIKQKLKTIIEKSGIVLRHDVTGTKTLLTRQKNALNNFENGYVMNPFLASSLFPSESDNTKTITEEEIDDFYAENLNESQTKAVRKALSSNGLFLIQGPPGTGKTHVIAEITAQMVKRNKKVLIASENNKAVDNAFDRLPKIPSIRLLRLINEERNKENQYKKELLLSNFYLNIYSSMEKTVNRLKNKEEYAEKLSEKIKDLEILEDNIKIDEKECKEVKKKIEEYEDERREIIEKIERKRKDNNEIEDEIFELEETKTQIKKIDDPEIQKKLIKLLSSYKLFKNNEEAIEAIRLINSYNRNQLIDIIGIIGDCPEYIKLLQSKKTAKNSELPKINKKLSELEVEKNINRKNINQLNSCFPNEIPSQEKIMKIKGLIDDTVCESISKIDKEIERKKKLGLVSTDDLNANRKIIEDKIEELKDDESYKNLDRDNKKLSSEINKVFSDLGLEYNENTPTAAINVLKRKKQSLEDVSPKNKKIENNKIKVFEKIIKYLKDENIIKHDSEKYNATLLNYVNVFGMTCTSNVKFKDYNGDAVQLNELNIDVVIIDEVSKIPFIELLQPILYGKTVILVGDQNQLCPMYQSELTEENIKKYECEDLVSLELDAKYKQMYEESYFGKLFNITADAFKTTLNIQYRMHPQIMKVDNVFYGNALTFGGKEIEKEHYLNITGARNRKIISESTHVVFIDCINGYEYKESGKTSFANQTEMEVVVKLLEMINNSCKYDINHEPLKNEYQKTKDKRLSVGIISMYGSQAKNINTKIKRMKKSYSSFNCDDDEKLLSKSVDDFQGDERDIIILSTVRTDPIKIKSCFMKKFQRINVAVSRARRLLIIVGNSAALSKIQVQLDGKRTEPTYERMISTIRKIGGAITDEDVLGVKKNE